MANKASKTYFAMEKGLNTEAPLIGFPDGYTTSEQNYELNIRGERRRRLGLGLEIGGNDISLTGYATGDIIRAHDWENVAGIPSINYEVVQIGYQLHIFTDTNPISPTHRSFVYDFRSAGVFNATDDQISTWPLESAFGRGHIFFFGKYTVPFYLEYNPDTDVFTATQILIRERDFQGADDGYNNVLQPVVDLPTHRYNLENRGWTDAFIDLYYADQNVYPSKNMIPWLGLKRALTGSNYYDQDGIRSFDPAKLAAEYFQDASAPQGHFIIDPFNTTVSESGTGNFAITTWSMSPPNPGAGASIVLTITTDAVHGLSVTDEVAISGLTAVYIAGYDGGGNPFTDWFDASGTYAVTSTPTTTSFTINATWANQTWQGWYNQYNTLGTAIVNSQLNPSGSVVDFRPKAGAFFAGRVWYAGIDTSRLTGRVYFSQVIEADAQYGKCYQIADPTDERISDLVPSDGGVIVIPEASNILKLVPYNSALLVFASNGVWEIGPGELGYFAATAYSVRKVSDSGAVSAGAVVLMDNTPVYWGVTDIYGIATDPQTGFLNTTNISQKVINTFYNNIPLAQKRLSVGVYDDLSKRLIWLYASSTDVSDYSYDRGLVFDARMGAFIPFTFAYGVTDYLAGIMLLKEAGEVSKVKYLGIINGNLVIGEANNYADYVDFGIAEPEAFMVTGFDSVRSPADFKQAPVVWVFSRKTETGYDESYSPIRESSTSMQARWEWADSASAGKWGREQEIYRHQRSYVPTGSSDTFDDGVPVVVTRNKLRGKGRVLQLKFTAGTGRDSYLMGWKTNFTKLGS